MEDVIVESIQIMGHDVYYIPREALDSVDLIFGEATKVKFKHAYLIESYIANVEGFEGDGDFFSKFGLEIRDTSNFVMSRRSFSRFIPSLLRRRPQEGDLIYVPLMHRIFEIKFVEKKLLFYSLGNREPYIYEMRCELFRYSEEQFETHVEEIDQVEEDNAYTQKINLSTSAVLGYVGNFIDGEIVYQSADGTYANNTSSAELKEWYAANGTMFIYNIKGSFVAGSSVIGNTSKVRYNLVSLTDEKNDFVTNDFFNNEDFDQGAELILDLSELNPFGSP